MEIAEHFVALQEKMSSAAHVKTVFGEPISAEGKTIIPVARVRWGFGSGFGKGPSKGQDASEMHLGQGGGGGGGVQVTPIGVVEVSAAGTRFIPFGQKKRIVLAAAIGFAIGKLLAR